VAGADGTLRRRFKDTPLAGIVRAKTGTLSNVRALSGYVPAANGEMLAFSTIVNNVTGTRQEVDAPIDQALARLAAFRR
jgi:D-alanyl-D-alanine carboxypeptidase/D-alanyl-D-alanine-endopeptidase (penicillin-binding protein 4)